MKWKSELIVKKTFLTSRRTSWSFLALFFLAGVISAFTESYDLKWLELIVPFLGGVSIILFILNCIMPGILILLGVPWLAYAWFQGLNLIKVPASSWDQLSNVRKFLIYVWSLFTLVFMLVAIIGVITHSTQR